MKNLTAALCLLFFLALPGFGQEGQKPRTKRVAILQVVDLTEAADDRINAGVKLFVRNSLASAITNTPGYEGYDRVNLSEISGEQRFQHSGAVKDDDIRKIGEATGAEYVLIIEMAKFDRNTFAISAKIIDVETLKMEGITPILSGMEPKDIEQATAGIAEQLLKKSEREAALQQQKEKEAAARREREELEKRQKEMEAALEKEKEKEELERRQREREAALEKEREREELEKRQREMEAALEKEREREELERRQKEALEKQQEELEIVYADPEGISSTDSGTQPVAGQDGPDGKTEAGVSPAETGAAWKPEAGSGKKPDRLRVLLAPQYSLPVSYGVMVGMMKKAGGYLRAKSNFENVVESCHCDRSGRIDGYGHKLRFTGDSRQTRWAVTGGYVQRLAKPLYLFLGAGYAESRLFWECTDYRLAEVDELSLAGVAAEVGMMLNLGKLAVTIGAQTTAFKTVELNVGIGLLF